MKTNLIIPIAILMLIFCQSNYSQVVAEDLHVSIDIGKNVSNLTANRKFRVRIENKTRETIKFEGKNATLGLSPAGKAGTHLNSYFAFIKINSDKIKSGETIEIEAQLDELHWYPTTVSYFAYSENPNLEKIISRFPGKYEVDAAAEIKPKNKKDYSTIYRAYSEPLSITLN